MSAHIESLPRPLRTTVRSLLCTQWALMALYTVLLIFPGDGIVPPFVRDVLVGNIVFLLPTAVIAARAVLVRADRVWCSLLVAGVLCFLSGNLVFLWISHSTNNPPYPSFADVGYLGIYPFAIAALLISLRARMGRLRQSIALDAVVGALAAATVCFWIIAPLTATYDLPAVQLMVSMAYPVCDVLVIAAAVGVLAVTGGRPGGFYPFLIAGLVVFAVADTTYAYRVAYDTYHVGQPLDALWAFGMVIVAHGVWRRRTPRQTRPEVGLASLWVVGLATLVVLIVLVAGAHGGAPSIVILVAAATLLACAARTLEAFARVRDLAAARRQALTDDLTQVGNRRLLYQRAEQALVERADGRSVALVLLDLDRFKEVNDSLGHHAGDALLQIVGERLGKEVNAFGSGLLLARLGGDEFAVVVPDVGLDAATGLAQRLHDCITGPVQLDNILLHTKASVGLALSPSHADNRSDLLRCADLAMYHAKRSGRGVAVYEPGLLGLTRSRLEMAELLHQGLHRDELEVHYQPQVDGHGGIPSVEALVRWRHPTLGLVAPDIFLPIAEERRLMPDVTRIVLDTALADCAMWRSLGHPMTVAVNLSAPDLLDISLPARVATLLAKHGLTPDALVLEITETNVMTDPVQAHETLHSLRQLGIELAVDDYGTGHCSLAYLRQLPVQELKLDKSFVLHSATDAKDAAIVTTTVQLTRALGLRMVGEGVEDADVAALLFAAGVDRLQGWHFARAVPVADLLTWCTARRVELSGVG